MRRCQYCEVEDPVMRSSDGYTECCNELAITSCDECGETRGMLYLLPGATLCGGCRP